MQELQHLISRTRCGYISDVGGRSGRVADYRGGDSLPELRVADAVRRDADGQITEGAAVRGRQHPGFGRNDTIVE